MTRTIRRGLFAGALLWPSLVAAQTPPATIEYYHVDAVGSVRAVTDANGSLVRTANYRPFGEGVGVAAGADPMAYAGKPRDAETSLDYFGARYYGSRAGRFTTVDPVMDVDSAVIDPQRWNRYAYARNNPGRYVDPDGRDIVLVVNQSLLDRAKAFRNSVSSWLGNGFVAGVVDGALASFAPATPDEVSASLLSAASPAALGAGIAGQWHHIATNKSLVSGWTEKFESIFSKAGMSLKNDAANKVYLVGHKGPHAAEYHRYVLNKLENAVRGLTGADYKRALLDALGEIREELQSSTLMTQKK